MSSTTQAILSLVEDAPVQAGSTGSTALEQPTLPDSDIRRRFDEAVRRRWKELARRVARVVILLLADSAASFVAFYTALFVSVPSALDAPHATLLRNAWPLLFTGLLIQPLVLQGFGAYRGGEGRVSLRTITLGVAFASGLGWARAEILQDFVAVLDATPWIYSVYAVLGVVFVFAGRLLVDRVISRIYRTSLGGRRMLIVGTDRQTSQVTASFESASNGGIRIVGRLSPSHTAGLGDVGTVADLEGAVLATRAEGVVIASNLPFDVFDALVHRCFGLGVSVNVIPRTIQQLGDATLELRQVQSLTLMQLAPKGLRIPQLAVKRLMDLVLTGVGVVMISPLLLLIAVAVKLDSRGPIFFSQIRAGVGGRPFRMFKFRTMVANADEMKQKLAHLNESGDPRLFKIKNDPRITRVGRLLRKTSLDELPQLFNVLRGEMSLVGPRPFFPGDLADYADHHFERLYVLPGITGLWQVSGRSDVVDFEDVVRLDSAYIRDWSIGRDLWILLKTLPAAFGRGAY